MNIEPPAQSLDVDNAWRCALAKLHAARDAVVAHGCFIDSLAPAAHLADTMEAYVTTSGLDYPWQHVPVTSRGRAASAVSTSPRHPSVPPTVSKDQPVPPAPQHSPSANKRARPESADATSLSTKRRAG